MTKPVTVIIPAYFDPTELAVPWKLLTDWGSSNLKITFTTIDGQPAQCDSLVLKGPIFGFFGPSKEARKAYEAMIQSEFLRPLKWDEMDLDAYDGV